MKMIIRGVNVDITPAMKTHIEEKIGRLAKYIDKIDNVEATIIVRVRNNEQIIEVTIPTDKYTLRAEETHTDLYAAVDLVIDKLEGQIRKHKTKLLGRIKKEPSLEKLLKTEEIESTNEPKIVKRKSVDSKPMGELEATLQMELIGHDFFIFDNIDEDCISVVYKRKDGNYGIINTK